MRASLFAALLVLSFSQVSHAGEGIFGAAGNERCGIGSKIFGGGQSISSQSSEESTDAVSLDSVSITFQTSGCSNSGLVAIPKQEVFYANANYEELKVEMASGRGETLEGYAEAMGCPSSAMGQFLETSKANYNKTFPKSSTNPTEMILNFRQGLKQNAVLAQSCNSLNT
jgi:hypothetical protein